MYRARSRNITAVALLVELGMAAAAIVLGWLIGRWPLDGVLAGADWLPRSASALIYGIAATGPLVVVLYLVSGVRIGPLLRLNSVVEQQIVPLFCKTTIAEMALICAAAGVGEEMFFRGLMQAAIAEALGNPYGAIIALGVASVGFGICHWITPTYAVLATGIGLYLGWLFLATGNLLAPIVAHGAYDFIALVYLVRYKFRSAGGAEPPDNCR